MQVDWISVKERLPIIPADRFAVSVLLATYDPLYAQSLRSNSNHVISDTDGMSTQYGMYGYTMYIDHPNNAGLRVEHTIGEPISAWFANHDKEKDFITSVYGDEGYEPAPFCDEVTHWMYIPDPPKAPTNYT